MPAVLVDELVVNHGGLVAVDGVSFSVESGEVVALLGPNGAGKTSTIDVLEGYRRPDVGRVRVLGCDPVADRRRLVDRVGVMLQEGGVHPGIRPAEILRLLAALHTDPADPEELLVRVGLADRRLVTWRNLSGGERQRLGLALALVPRPRVAFLDEPTSGVDVQGRRVIRGIVRELADDGCAVLLCTHELDEAEKIADRVVIMDAGRVLATGTVDELRATATTRIRFSARAGLDVGDLGAAIGHVVAETGPGEYEVQGTTAPSPSLTAAIAAWLADHDVELGDLRAGRHRLEDVFLALTGNAAGDPATRDPDASRVGPVRARGRRHRRGRA